MSQADQPSRIAVLLFTDMVDSVALEQRLGTQAYSRLLMQHHELLRRAMTAAGPGTIHLDTGDGCLCEFRTAADAVNAALLFEMFLREHKWESAVPKVRIGIHQGQLAEIRSDPAAPGKIVGMPVNIAARVMGIAQGGQVLITRPIYDDARQFVREHPAFDPSGPAPPPLKWKSHGLYHFKGSDAPVEVFEVGASGYAPLTVPHDSDKGRRVAAPRRVNLALPHRRVIGAVVTAFCGLILLAIPPAQKWADSSYDYLFRFVARTPTNKVALILMDTPACDALGQTRNTWNRALHAQMLNQLTEGGCPIVVFDICFRSLKEKESDAALADALRRQGHVVLMSKLSDPRFPVLDIQQVITPDNFFRDASAGTGIGQANLRPEDTGGIVRRHWPFPAPADERFESLPWVAARLAGARLNEKPQKQWLRYYGETAPWEVLSYHLALSNAPSFFRDKIVFIGNKPENINSAVAEPDKFRTPYTSKTGEEVGGVEILATTFLNLMNGDWLRQTPILLETLILAITGVLLGAGLCRFGRFAAFGIGAGAALVFFLAGILLSYFTNFWFPWIFIVAGQIPIALLWAVVPVAPYVKPQELPRSESAPPPPLVAPSPRKDLPDAPDYELFDPPFGEGGFGKVWLARNAIGQWQALKAIYQAKFKDNPGPYDAEFAGLQKYKPVSEKHPGLLRIDLVSKKKSDGYFYYIMELGDSLNPGWEQHPELYKPKDLETLRRSALDQRLPVAECLRIGIILADALGFLHSQGLTHRDIKPSNIIFVDGRPKLADVGLVTNIRPLDQIKTSVGTTGYLPLPPERAGTVQADIYALGMVLYVIGTGADPHSFPNIPTAIMDGNDHARFLGLDGIILKACQPDCTQRYQTATEMLAALRSALAP